MNLLRHYHRHQEKYNKAWTAATGDRFDQADFETRQNLLDQAVRFGLLSTQTRVPQQETAYQASLDIGPATVIRDCILKGNEGRPAADDAEDYDTLPSTLNADRWQSQYEEDVYTRARAIWSEMTDALRDAGVNYANNKAAYIIHNAVEPDYETILGQGDNNAYDTVHRRIADEFLGGGLSKGAYAMGKLGCAGKLCIDTHVAAAAGIDVDDLYQGVVVERYEDQCEQVETAFPELSELPRPIFRWIVFDAHRNTAGDETPVTLHETWFNSV